MKQLIYRPLTILVFTWLAFSSCGREQKPVVWVYTDMTDPRDQRKGGHPQTDPDDICSMASLLLSANRYQIESIVVASTDRKGLADPMPFVSEVFVNAYQHDLPYLNATFGGYPDHIPFQQSSITKGGRAIQFDPSASYADLSDLTTVQQLVDAAVEKPIYVLSWGPLTESAMAVKHCIETSNEKALRNLIFISHWTKSSVSQGTPETPFKVANCTDDAAACTYMHDVAKDNPLIKFIELGCVGQKGIVDGSKGFSSFTDFNKSRLGQIFIRSKFYNGTPDQSDASTHWLLSGILGIGLEAYPNNGTLSQIQEEEMVNVFYDAGQEVMQDLLERSNAAAKANDPFSEGFLAEYFTYVYYTYYNKQYGAYFPYPAVYNLLSMEGDTIRNISYEPGNYKLEVDDLSPGKYQAIVQLAGIERRFTLEKVQP